MFMLSLWIAALAILPARGIEDDPFCLVQLLGLVTPNRFFINPESNCEDLDSKFDFVRKEIGKCTDSNVSINKLELLYKDFCDIDSNFRKEFNRHQKCFEENSSEINSCYGKMTAGPSYFGSTRKATCSMAVRGITDCLNEKVGKSCGDSGLDVYSRMTEAQEGLLTGICLETANGATRNSAISWCLMLGVLFATIWIIGCGM